MGMRRKACRGKFRLGRLAIGPSLVIAMAALTLPTGAAANVLSQTISSPGPFESITLGNDLSCQVKLSQDTDFSFYPPDTSPGDCGTFLKVNGTVYSPDFANHDDTAADGFSAWTPFSPASQTPVTGSGTASDPFTVVTTANAGASGVSVRERSTYVTGSQTYASQITVLNSTINAVDVTLYKAADCYLANTDFGYGAVNPSTGGVFCTENANNSPTGRTIGFTPGEGPSSHYVETFWDGRPGDGAVPPGLWARIDGSPLSDTCDCTVFQDNGAGLSWSLNVPKANAQQEVSSPQPRLAPGDATVDVRSFLDKGAAFTIGKVKGKKVSVTVPGAGTVDIRDKNAAKKLLLKPSSKTASDAGTIKVKLKLTKTAKKKLKHKHKVKVKAAITFTPSGGPGSTQNKALKVKK